ncbi:MAG: type I pullulanase [Clostridia bacterium]|nr:type I pullulanase [Clostridia bacterium]
MNRMGESDMTDPAKCKALFDSEAFEREYHCDAPLGTFCAEEGTHFALWAPTAQAVTLRLYGEGHWGEAFACLPLVRGARGLWTADLGDNLDGVYYDYEVTVDGQTRQTADPYARACGANGWRSMVIDLARTDPEGWADDRAPKRQTEDIIYELHVRDFSWDASSGVPEAYRGKYKALTLEGTRRGGKGRTPTCLAHLKHLGVTHVQLLPVYDYGSVDECADPRNPNVFNWGYDPVNYNVPEGSYATDPYHGEVRIRELKEAVQALHRAGLRVVMDVVYNHTYHLDSWLFRTAPWYHYRQNEDGSASNGSGCGSEIATERSMCTRYILDSVLYWAEEYHIDGFRFDLMGLMDAPLMERIRSELDRRYGAGEKLVYGEPWTGGTPHARPGTALCHKQQLRHLHTGIGAFCDGLRDAVKGSVFHAREGGFVNGGPFSVQQLAQCIRGYAGEQDVFSAPSQTIAYLSAHDDWTLWDKLVMTIAGDRRFVPLRGEILRANRLAAATYLCCQGRPFFLGGEEFGRTKLGERNSYRSWLGINRMDWNRAGRCRALVDYYRGLIALRRKLPALYDKGPQAGARLWEVREIGPRAAAVWMDNAGEGSVFGELLLCFNYDQADAYMQLPQGEWTVLADGEDSFLHEHPYTAEGRTRIAGMACLILGR